MSMLKKLTNAVAAVSLLAGAAMPLVTHAAISNAFDPGALIKASGQTVYYFAENGKRYVFPNEKTYFSWYKNFDTVVTISDQMLSTIPIGGNVTYRPGVKMLKITTDPRTYVVDRGGILRHVGSEQLAQTLYNINWKGNVEDLPDAFFINYRIGDPIATATEFKPADVMTQTTAISQDKGFDDTVAAVSIGNTATGYVPSSMTIKKGTTVTWTNQDSASHSVVGASWQSDPLAYGKSYSHKFSEVGSFEYHDGLNTSVKSTINVR